MSTQDIRPGDDRSWTEVADGCFVRVLEPYGVHVVAVVGADGIALIDTGATAGDGALLAAELDQAHGLPVRAVINTHGHFDHSFGNASFPGATVVGHETVVDTMAGELARAESDGDLDGLSDATTAALRSTEPRVPDVTFASVWAHDAGGRLLELVHTGRGHTGGDVAVRVPDADLVVIGDLAEAHSALEYGSDSFPLEWADTLDLLIGLTTEASVIVAGHAGVIDRDQLQLNRQTALDVGQRIRELATSGVPVEEAVARDVWPSGPSPDSLGRAVRRGYVQLGH